MSVLYAEDKVERSNKDRLQGAAPDLGIGMDKSGLDSPSQEAIWLFVRNKLMIEQENGEGVAGAGPAQLSLLLLCVWVHGGTGLPPSRLSVCLLPPLRIPKRQMVPIWDPILQMGKLSPKEKNCPKSLNQPTVNSVSSTSFGFFPPPMTCV